MILNDLGFIITDTPRAYIYLQVLKKNNILPSYILYLKKKEKDEIPEFKNIYKYNYKVPKKFHNICGKTISTKLDLLNQIEKLKIKYDVYKTTNVHNSFVIKRITSRKEKNFIYAGYGGIILKKNLLNTKKNFIHIHGGYLPNYKGSTTNYYSILEEKLIGASSIFMNSKIDSGPILQRYKFKMPSKKIDMDNFYDSLIRSVVLIRTLENYIKNKKWKFLSIKERKENKFYIIHPVLKHVAILS